MSRDIGAYNTCPRACTYCYARYTHGFFDLPDWQDFERRIFVKRGAADSLRRRLRKSDLRGQPISIGTATDPYQPAERHFRVTRSLLEVFTEAEGLSLTVATKSPLILRDLELLIELDRRHSVTVALSLTTLDPALARRIELRAPDPQARLRTLRRLTAAGICTKVFVMPLMPGINDHREELEPRGPAGAEAYPDAEKKGPVMQGLKISAAFGLVVSVTMGGLMMINPVFMDTRWPWSLDPFNARVMSAFFALTALWCVNIYLAEDWVEVKKTVLGLVIFALSQFTIWLVNLGSFDPARENIPNYGIGLGLFALLFIYYYIMQERASREA